MKNIKFKRIYLLELTIAIIISVGIVSIFGFRYLTQVHSQSIRHSKMFIQTHKRIDILEERLKEKCTHNTPLKPVSL